MVKNFRGGSKHKKHARKKNTENKYDFNNLKKDDGQEYGFLLENLGSCRFRVMCWDKVIRLGHIRGKLRKRCYFKAGDLALISLRDFQDEKCDIIEKYDEDQINILITKSEISEQFTRDGKTFPNDISQDSTNMNISDEPETSLKDYINNNVGCIGGKKQPYGEINEDDLDSDDFDLI